MKTTKIFLNGEYDYAGVLVERFAGYHRQSYGGCKVGVGDVLIGAAAVAAEYNGAQRASHIKDKLIEMTHLNETLYCCGIACSAEGTQTESGNYIIDLLLANVCKQNVTRFPYEIARLAEDIAGGLMVTAPSEKDLKDPKLGAYIRKCRCRLQNRVHAWCRFSTGSTYHDLPTGQSEDEERTCKSNCKN